MVSSMMAKMCIVLGPCVFISYFHIFHVQLQYKDSSLRNQSAKISHNHISLCEWPTQHTKKRCLDIFMQKKTTDFMPEKT